MGTVDRVVRTLAGVTCLILGPATGFLSTGVLSNAILGMLGLFAIASAMFAYCVLYEIAGFCTLKEQL